MNIKYKTVNGKQYIDNWFSNMLPLDEPYIYQGIKYRTVENFYQAMKLPKDRIDLRAEIAAMNPFKSKTSIRDKNKYPWREDWESEKLKVMDHILRVKFAPGTSWAQKLLETGDEEIVEWNNWLDFFWGRNPNTLKGENWLGELLMIIRSDLGKNHNVFPAKPTLITNNPETLANIYNLPPTQSKEQAVRSILKQNE